MQWLLSKFATLQFCITERSNKLCGQLFRINDVKVIYSKGTLLLLFRLKYQLLNHIGHQYFKTKPKQDHVHKMTNKFCSTTSAFFVVGSGRQKVKNKQFVKALATFEKTKASSNFVGLLILIRFRRKNGKPKIDTIGNTKKLILLHSYFLTFFS